MTIHSVFRVQCDGPCKGWLSVPPGLIGRDIMWGRLTVEPTAVHAGNWPGERAARTAAYGAGWKRNPVGSTITAGWFCPDCKLNPLGIVLPTMGGPICVDPRCPRGHAHYGPCPDRYRKVDDL